MKQALVLICCLITLTSCSQRTRWDRYYVEPTSSYAAYDGNMMGYGAMAATDDTFFVADEFHWGIWAYPIGPDQTVDTVAGRKIFEGIAAKLTTYQDRLYFIDKAERQLAYLDLETETYHKVELPYRNIYQYYIVDDKLYGGASTEEGRRQFVSELDGSGMRDLVAWARSYDENWEYPPPFTVYEGYLYYENQDDEYRLWRMKVETGEQEFIGERMIDKAQGERRFYEEKNRFFQLTPYGIIFPVHTEAGDCVYRMDFGGGERELLCTVPEGIERFCVLGQRVAFTKGTEQTDVIDESPFDNSVYQLAFGSNKEPELVIRSEQEQSELAHLKQVGEIYGFLLGKKEPFARLNQMRSPKEWMD